MVIREHSENTQSIEIRVIKLEPKILCLSIIIIIINNMKRFIISTIYPTRTMGPTSALEL